MAEEYSKAVQTIEKIKSRLYGEVIKHLIDYSWNPAKCTEASISKDFDLPRSTIRPILEELVEKGVLKYTDLERLKPFSVQSVGRAIDEGYLEFSKDEVQKIFSPKEAKDGSEVASANPGLGGIGEDGKPKYRWLGQGQNLGIRTLVARFISFLSPTSLEKVVGKLFSSEEYKGLNLYLPEYFMFEPIFQFGFVGESGHYTPIYRENIEDLVSQLGLKEEYSDEETRNAIVTAFERRMEFALNRLQIFALMLEEKGYHDTSKMIPHYGAYGPYKVIDGKFMGTPIKFKKSYVWAMTQALRQGCKIGQKLGISSDLIQEAQKLSEILDKATEKEYEGAEKNGSLDIWYKKQVTA